jgi:hypothetical protein
MTGETGAFVLGDNPRILFDHAFVFEDIQDLKSHFNTLAKIMRGEKTGFSGKVMSLTTTQYLKTHERDYNTDPLSGPLSVKNAVKAIAADYHGATMHPWTGDHAEPVALERRRG